MYGKRVRSYGRLGKQRCVVVIIFLCCVYVFYVREVYADFSEDTPVVTDAATENSEMISENANEKKSEEIVPVEQERVDHVADGNTQQYIPAINSSVQESSETEASDVPDKELNLQDGLNNDTIDAELMSTASIVDSAPCDTPEKALHIILVSIGDMIRETNDVIGIENRSDHCIALQNVKLRKRYKTTSIKEESIKAFGSAENIAPHTRLFWAKTGSRFEQIAQWTTTASLSKNYSIGLIWDSPEGNRVLDGVTWGEMHDGFSEDTVPNPSDREYITRNSAMRFIIDQQCAEKILSQEPCIPPYNGQKILITEWVPNPYGDESQEEYIELFNPSQYPVDLFGWVIGDATDNGRYTFPYNTKIDPQDYYVIKRADFHFALNNTSGETVRLWAPDGTLVDTSVAYGSFAEGVGYNRTTDEKWRWSQWKTPGEENQFNAVPLLKKIHIPHIVYRDVPTTFSVRAYDADGATLKYRWDFGDQKRSYKEETRHTFTKNGKYMVSVRVSDGTEFIEENQMIAVRSYPHYKIALTEIVPNPKGKDLDKEFVKMRNSEKKNIVLTGWFLATGRSDAHLVRHRLQDDIEIAKNESVMITHLHAAITLPNTSAIIALLSPDGRIASRVQYVPPYGKKTVPDDARYVRDGSEWRWIVQEESKKTKKTAVHTIQMQALKNERELFVNPIVQTQNVSSDQEDGITYMIRTFFDGYSEDIHYGVARDLSFLSDVYPDNAPNPFLITCSMSTVCAPSVWQEQ